ncbi:hypothetical protein QQM39_42800 [Streptomyces sp. DT2A-34]|nr:hypothetical protein [Streptomyces sp. DT2A-34]MDO0917297.1 hypothetical protein [Streptomyces sp. DT2A-34]
MFTVTAHAATSPGEPLAPTSAEHRDPGRHDVAQSVIRLLTRLVAMP